MRKCYYPLVTKVLLSFLAAFLAAGPLYAPPQRRLEHHLPVESAITLREFGQLMASLSEPEGFFDSDNFVSNESAYLKVLPVLKRLALRGGAYIGVGPDQNYSYLAEIQPRLVFIVDIRRQNALQHLYCKALFQLSSDRFRYFERLFGRPLGREPAGTKDAAIAALLKRVGDASANRAFARQKIIEAVQLIRSWDIGLNGEDFKAIEYVAQAFIEGGPDLKFTSYNRPPRSNHPTYRSLLEETDSSGAQANYLAQEERFQFVKKLHRENRIVPIVGDLGGVSALQRVAQELRRRDLPVTCFYVSNVEFYLFHGARWNPYVQNLRALPWASNGCIVRSYANMWQPHPAKAPGYYMTTIAQLARDFFANESTGRNATYWDVVTRDYMVR